VLLGCTTHDLRSSLYDYAVLSQRSAEGLYQAIYAASRQGHIPPEILADARLAYAQWSTAQALYLLGAEAGQLDAVSAHAMQAQVDRLAAIAREQGVHPWKSH